MNIARFFELITLAGVGFSIGLNAESGGYGWLILPLLLASWFAVIDMEAPL